METIPELMKELDRQIAELKKALEELDQPFAGAIDLEQAQQVEDDRALDHFRDEQI
jgi:Sec-independent protein translocase protein TatA